MREITRYAETSEESYLMRMFKISNTLIEWASPERTRQLDEKETRMLGAVMDIANQSLSGDSVVARKGLVRLTSTLSMFGIS